MSPRFHFVAPCVPSSCRSCLRTSKRRNLLAAAKLNPPPPKINQSIVHPHSFTPPDPLSPPHSLATYMPAPCLHPDLGAHRGPAARRRGARRVLRGLPVKVKHIVRWIKTPSRPAHLTATMPAPVESSAVHFPIAQRDSADVLTFSTHQGVNRPAPSMFFPLSLMPFVSVSLLHIVLSFPAS